MPTEPPKVDWEQAKRCLAALHRESPAFLSQALLIGGAACWFYRYSLQRAADPEFPVPPRTPAQDLLWLSKDLDFTAIFSADALTLLPRLSRQDREIRREFLQVEGVRLGFAQVGLTIDPEEAMQRCWVGSFAADSGMKVEFFVADPVTLYREKLALTERRNAPADSLHLALLAEFVRREVCLRAEQLGEPDALALAKQALNFLTLVRDRAPDLLADERVRRRVNTRLERKDRSLTETNARFLRELVA